MELTFFCIYLLKSLLLKIQDDSLLTYHIWTTIQGCFFFFVGWFFFSYQGVTKWLLMDQLAWALVLLVFLLAWLGSVSCLACCWISYVCAWTETVGVTWVCFTNVY